MNKLNIDILYGTARKPKISLFNEKKGVHRSGWGNFEKKTHKFKGPGWSNFEKEIHAINKPLIKFKSKRGIRHSFKLNIKNKSSQLILRMSQKKPFSIKHLRQSAVKLTPYIKIPLYFPVYKRLKHYRMLAPFYGFLWDRVRRERIVNITLGLKRNYSLLLPVFYSSRKYFNITNINHINFESWKHLSYIFNNSFHKNLNYLSLNNLDQTTTRLHSSLGRAYNLLEYDEIVVFNNYAQMAIDTYIDMNNFNYTISCFDWSSHFDINGLNNIKYIVNSGYSKTSLFTLGYINEKVVDTKLYFNLISRIENISKIFEISPAPHKYNILNIVNKLYYKLRGHVNYILNQIYIKLFNKIYDKLSGTARSQKSITSSKIITEISLIMRLKSRVSIAPSRLRSNTQPNKYNIFLGYSRRLFLREAKLHTPYRNSFKDRCISNLYYSRRRKLIVLIKNNLYIFLKTSYIWRLRAQTWWISQNEDLIFENKWEVILAGDRDRKEKEEAENENTPLKVEKRELRLMGEVRDPALWMRSLLRILYMNYSFSASFNLTAPADLLNFQQDTKFTLLWELCKKDISSEFIITAPTRYNLDINQSV